MNPAAAAPRPAWLRPTLLATPLLLLFAALLIYPVGQLLLLSVYSDGAFTTAKYRQLFESSVYVDVLLITLKIAAPILMAGVVVGLVISLLQSITSIQEQTLAFVPKIAAMMLVAVLLLPWIVQRLVEFTVEMLSGF